MVCVLGTKMEYCCRLKVNSLLAAALTVGIGGAKDKVGAGGKGMAPPLVGGGIGT